MRTEKFERSAQHTQGVFCGWLASLHFIAQRQRLFMTSKALQRNRSKHLHRFQESQTFQIDDCACRRLS